MENKRGYKVSGVLALLGVFGASLVSVQTAYAAPVTSQTISVSGSFTLPADVSNIRVTLKGASGSGGAGAGAGGVVELSLPDSFAGQTLDFLIGAVGNGSQGTDNPNYPRAGGGGTAVRQGAQVLGVVGGGGSGGWADDGTFVSGGNGGAPTDSGALGAGDVGSSPVAGSLTSGKGGSNLGGAGGQGNNSYKGQNSFTVTETSLTLALGGQSIYVSAGWGGSGCTGGGGGGVHSRSGRTENGGGGGGSGCLPSGSTATVVAGSQSTNVGAGSAEISYELPMPWSRISGVNRYDTAAKISQAAYPDGASTVYVVNGLGFADSLSAGPAAMMQDAPVLLTAPTSLPAETVSELQRLRPAKIVVVGGTGSVSAAVEAQLVSIAPVTRVAGDNRYATSRAVAAYAFTRSGSVIFATGAGFADALSASAAAASSRYPLILVDGSATMVDPSTAATLTNLRVQSAFITGGVNSVSGGIENSLETRFGASNVERFAGSDRYQTSVALNSRMYTSPSKAYIASGVTFPDALAGAALAAADGGQPLYVSPTSCLTQGMYDSIEGGASITGIVLLGGVNSLSDNVGKMAVC